MGTRSPPEIKKLLHKFACFKVKTATWLREEERILPSSRDCSTGGKLGAMESTQSAQAPANGHHHRSQHSTRAALNQIGAKGGIAIVVGSLFAAVVSMCVVAFCVWMWGNRGGSGSIDQEQQQLGDHHQPRAIASQGLSSKAIDRIPKVSFATLFQIRGASDVCCPVCLTEFQASDHSGTIWLIPGCNHSFHSECIQKWLAAHTSCPVCRVTIKD
ncbi:RING-H2 finger protein ATL80-like [Selaginella moellendorffii]|uniref:RING-H2 finger protein ATL80-like n=1 Tax=Selaginella moellendorffii TaxID=88036 RepID=UPI000D1CD662|nr:RING-H2 finger protein ATL80-like [Selaginella moellendorffii]|eukprot:XP_024522959.1 RING-H2 finger protein ATL80-like [Selaginella moellendorffii]